MAFYDGYATLKAGGFASVQKPQVGVYTLTLRQFSPSTGAEGSACVMVMNKTELQREKTALVSQLADLNALIADLQALG